MHTEKLIYAGRPLEEAKKALIMIHGRGGSAEDILALATNLNIEDYALAAPQATNNSWYPNSFLVPPSANEPWLSSAIKLVDSIVKEIIGKGIRKENIYILGFSQGACLTLEYAARNAARFGGIIAFTGGLIGNEINPVNFTGDFEETQVFIGTSDSDAHVPVSRVYASVNILKDMNAVVTEKVYTNMGHTINQDEIDTVNSLFFKIAVTADGI